MRIASIETRVYRYPLDPPFHAAWDPVPRTHQDATIVVVRSDDGVEGYASGDGLPDRELLERLLLGVDATDTRPYTGSSRPSTSTTAATGHSRSRSGISVGRMHDKPLWRLLGGSATASAPTRRPASSSRRGARPAVPSLAECTEYARSSSAFTRRTGASTSR